MTFECSFKKSFALLLRIKSFDIFFYKILSLNLNAKIVATLNSNYRAGITTYIQILNKIHNNYYHNHVQVRTKKNYLIFYNRMSDDCILSIC